MARKPKSKKRGGKSNKMGRPGIKPSPSRARSVPTTLIEMKGRARVILAADLIGSRNPVEIPQETALDSTPREAPAVNLKFKDTIRVINEMQAAGVISHYANGGAVAATFYLEPVRTADLDIFIPVHQEPGRIIVTLDPIAAYLKPRGYAMKDEYWEIEGTLVQFMPIEGDALLEEAITQTREFEVEGVGTFVFSAEHMVAIALKVGRPDKDVPRIQQFIREKMLDEERLFKILKRHHLSETWSRFQQKYLNPEK